MQDSPKQIISIAVFTYNSAKTVLETLDSVYSQTYSDLALIVSDDCSADDTLDICRKWIKKHESRFASIKIITTPENTGVTANCQRIWDACDTEWIKYIAGDDVLYPNCISDFVEYIQQHKEALCVYSRADVIGLSDEEKELFIKKRFDYTFFDLPQEKRYEKILPWCCIPTEAAILNNEKLRAKGLNFDLRVPMLEDRIFYLRALALGVYFDFMDKVTIGYRVRRDSLCNSPLLSPKYYESFLLANFYYPFAYKYSRNPEEAIRDMVNQELGIYREYYQLKKESLTTGYKIFQYIAHPSKIIEKFHSKF